ncbi:multicopper oxidase domain-containing protein [Sphaerotilus montanus]|uniref:Spore coat protein A n=1 Tax=Sphaerotilus montanus TaxID=522889 RepID=A0A7Y9UD89_9BURK|nr:multicopper oxidase domain-containing protein [Sphaerotilus montanus]NYG34349.1 spore coat protein A [Sphaerotilus montanus]NZD57868.1 multicopper oxidase domain-containing protein [Sphaerotilus montanus]
MISRRSILKRGAVASLGATTSLSTANAQTAAGQVTTGTQLLQGGSHPKFVQPLPNPNAPLNAFAATTPGGSSYTLLLREFVSQIGLVSPAGNKLSTVLWGYGTPTQSPTSPGRSFSVRSGSKITVSYVNQLGAGPRQLGYRLPLDTTLMWANPGNLGGLAPVPLVAHRHGGDQPTITDGLPDAWTTADRNLDGQPDYAGRLWSTPYTYQHQQEAGHLWYHDHALGVTRLNVFMGLAGHYFIRDANEDWLLQRNRLPASPYEVPLVIQDRMFDSTGRLFYPSTDPLNPSAPRTTHLPEFFGDFILVNGVPWPQHAVEPRAYRLRVLNGSDSRFYDLQFRRADGNTLAFHQVGTELGLMNAPVPLTHLVLAPGERADLVVSFRGLAGQRITLVNTAPTPFPFGAPVDPASAGQIMAFPVSLALDTQRPHTTLPASLRPVLGPLPALVTAGVPVRKLLLVEGVDPYNRLQTLLGTVNPAAGNPTSPAHGTFFYSDPVTERMALGSTELWEFHNTTVDAHPIHLHQTAFRVLNRQAFDGVVVPKPMGAGGSTVGGWLTGVTTLGPARPAEPNEAGRKDTVVAYPGEITRILVRFDRPGEYVWHCHILSHEDHEMMRRFVVA